MAPDTVFTIRQMRPQRGVELAQVSIPQCRPHEVLVQLGAAYRGGTELHIYNLQLATCMGATYAWDARPT